MKKSQSKSIPSKTKTTLPDSRLYKQIISKTQSCLKINQKHHKLQYSNVPTDYIAKIKANKPKKSVETTKILLKTDREHLSQHSQQLIKENSQLKEKYCQLQSNSLQDKQKIKALITRISELKQATTIKHQKQNSNQQHFQRISSKSIIPTPYKLLNSNIHKDGYCSKICEDRKRYLEIELYKERIRRDQLELAHKEWQQSKQQLRVQYNQLLHQIKILKQEN